MVVCGVWCWVCVPTVEVLGKAEKNQRALTWVRGPGGLLGDGLPEVSGSALDLCVEKRSGTGSPVRGTMKEERQDGKN